MPHASDHPCLPSAQADRLPRELIEHPLGRALARLRQNRPPTGHAVPRTVPQTAIPTCAPPAPSLADLVERDAKLYSLPEIYARLDRLMKDPNTTADDVTRLISMDPALCATLLRIVNSAFLGRSMRAVGRRSSRRVESLSRAVMIVGTAQLAVLALGLSVVPSFRDIPPSVMDMRRFWEHSLSCAILAQELGAGTGREEEPLFVAGLLHDIGKLCLFRHAPEQAARLMAQAQAECTPLVDLEGPALGFTHADLGGALLVKWHLPETLSQAVAGHHAPAQAGSAAFLVRAADFVAEALADPPGLALPLPPFDPYDFDLLSLSPEAFEAVVQRHDEQFTSIRETFFPAARS